MTREHDTRAEIFTQLYSLRPLAATPALMARQARKAGLDFTETELARECAFLLGQGLVQKIEDPVAGTAKYAITSKGIVEYEQAS